MIFEMKALGFLMLLTVGSKASINKLFFLGPDVNIICPLDAPFYQWKKYHNQKMTNIFQDDKKRLNISLKLEDSPTDYECGATSGFEKKNFNITVFILDRNSKKAQELCYLEPIRSNTIVKHRVQYPCFLRYQYQTETRTARGLPVTFDCEAGGTNVTYSWFKKNNANSHRASIIIKNYASHLEVNYVDEKSVGSYLCVVDTSTGKKLERVFELSTSEDPLSGNAAISIENPEIINITAKLNKNQKLDCSTKVPSSERVQAIQWGKKLDTVSPLIDKNQIILWEGNSYKLLPETQSIDKTESESKIISYMLFKEVTLENTGEYICVIVTNSGLIKYKTFFVTLSSSPAEEEAPRSFFFLYILIPSLIIAVCLFIGIYLTFNRRPGRKASNFTSTSKSENDTTRLRTTPDYSSNQYQTRPPPVVQYPPNQKYFNPYYPSSDKLMV